MFALNHFFGAERSSMCVYTVDSTQRNAVWSFALKLKEYRLLELFLRSVVEHTQRRCDLLTGLTFGETNPEGYQMLSVYGFVCLAVGFPNRFSRNRGCLAYP